jgi:hypothetical protein
MMIKFRNSRGRVRQRTTAPPDPTDPCVLYPLALQRLNDLLLGQAAVRVDTPNLGSVEYNQADISKLQQYVNQLADACAAETNGTGPTPRGPISFEAWP